MSAPADQPRPGTPDSTDLMAAQARTNTDVVGGRLSRVKVLLQRLPPAWRAAGLAVVLVAMGFGAGLALSSRSPATPTEALVRWAKRINGAHSEQVRRALAWGDPLSALALLRSSAMKDRLRADPAALVVRAQLALDAREPSDALEMLELAITASPEIVEDPLVARAVIQTFNAGKVARTGVLLSRLERDASIAALRTACNDWSSRVRHGAIAALKGLGAAEPDPVRSWIADAWQAERCDLQRAAVARLLPAQTTDERVPPALEALGRRPVAPGCLDDLLSRAAK